MQGLASISPQQDSTTVPPVTAGSGMPAKADKARSVVVRLAVLPDRQAEFQAVQIEEAAAKCELAASSTDSMGAPVHQAAASSISNNCATRERHGLLRSWSWTTCFPVYGTYVSSTSTISLAPHRYCPGCDRSWALVLSSRPLGWCSKGSTRAVTGRLEAVQNHSIGGILVDS